MSEAASSENDANLDVLGDFLNDLRRGGEPAEVVARYCGRHPKLAEQFRDLVEVNALLERAPDRSTEGYEPVDPQGERVERLGPYRIVGVLGRGGMGDVFEAIEEPLDRRVAVKTVRGGRGTRPDWMRRFLHEREVLARLHHTNIVPIFAAGQEGDLLYFAMPCIPGATLGQVVRTARRAELRTPGQMASTFEDLVVAAHLGGDGAALAPAGAVPPAASPDAAAETPAPAVVVRFDYVRSVVRLMASVAEALHHAHQAGVVHRDLKPSNLMVEPGGHPWVLDFGLAHVGPGVASLPGACETDTSGGPARWSATVGVVGTPPYMAPEQFRDGGPVDARTDVWGIGVTLYELLTLQPAFTGRESVLGSEPAAPRRLVRGLPRDLDAIVLKAIRKDPADRYTTALALAQDLHHCLGREPVEAWPRGRIARPARRAWMWSVRNKGWAAAAVAVAVSLVWGATLVVARERAERRDGLVQRLQRVRLTAHAGGWSDAVWSLVSQAADLPRDDAGSLQGQAVASLAGLDARVSKRIPYPAAFLAFDPRGRRLYMAGPERPGEVWDAENDRREPFSPPGDGPLAFRPDGTPCQLDWSPDDPGAVQVHNLGRAGVVNRLATPGGLRTRPHAWNVTPDASRVGACLRSDGGEAVVAIWDGVSGRLVRAVETGRADGLAIAPDGSLMAAVTGVGEVTVWPLPGGPPVATLKARDVRLNCLAFGRDPVRPEARAGAGSMGSKVGSGWLLAAGDAGGLVTVYDLRTAAPRSYCRGSHHDVFAVAFRPDGMTLASAGREQAMLWDVATGRLLLGLPYRNTMNALAFTPDGSRLAVASQAVFDPEPSVDVWDLKDGRGIREFRGLQGVVEKAVFSPDGRRVAGLSVDWQVGVWECTTGRLLHVFDLPPGDFADNAGLAFSPDGRRFAAAAGRAATLWDLDTGRVTGSWPLAEGLQDNLLFLGPDRLLLARAETKDGRERPYGRYQAEHARVCRVRDLLGVAPLKPLVEVTDFPFHVHRIEISSDGRWLVVGGAGGADGKTFAVTAYEASTGKRLWSMPAENLNLTGRFQMDPTAKVFAVETTGQGFNLLTMPGRAPVDRVRRFEEFWLGPGGRRWMAADLVAPLRMEGYEFFERGRDRPLFVLPAERSAHGTLKQFSPDGRWFAWGNSDGGVAVIDLTETQRRLATVGLGW